MLADTVVLATSNKGKIRELTKMLDTLGVKATVQSEWNVPEAEETGLTFIENAIIKARNACEHTGLPAIADDSGIEIDALNGAPGIYSARFAGPGCSDSDNNKKLIEALADIPKKQKTARYRAVLVYMRHAKDPSPLIAQGTWEGRIIDQPHGENGFGYDPYFYIPELGKTGAELDPGFKNEVSHRAKALRKLIKKLKKAKL